jgi:EAL domain-containing protein (putative c-di-GMP-specific phosphodiesterase class I)
VARELGCDRVQGSHVHPGAPGHEVAAWLGATYGTVRAMPLDV